MLKFLQNIFGKSSKSYEDLMASKGESSQITSADIETATNLLSTLRISSHALIYKAATVADSPRIPESWPINKKGEPLTYLGTLCIDNKVVEIFMHDKSFMKDETNLQVFVHHGDDYTSLPKLEISDANYIANELLQQQPYISLPIWEEIIHRDKSIHKQLVQLAPDNPWTLYKKAKQNTSTVNSETIGYLGGYPQWMINDMDYRKIEKLDFLIQLSREKEHAYIFLDADKNLQAFYQRY